MFLRITKGRAIAFFCLGGSTGGKKHRGNQQQNSGKRFYFSAFY